MTPRERAEALGWRRCFDAEAYGDPFWSTPHSPRWDYSPVRKMGYGWGVWFRQAWTGKHPTESAAIAAALELRDVVLS